MALRRESKFARLEELLREADKQAKRERKRAEDAKVRAGDAKERAEQERRRAEDEQQNRIKEATKTRPTTFEEYLRTCHTFLLKPLHTQTDKSLSTQGSITGPKNKPCLKLLKPWTDFLIL